MYLACKPKIFAIWIFKKKFSNSDINVVCFLVFFFGGGGGWLAIFTVYGSSQARD